MIYPNPANDYINLKSESIIDGYIIYDIKGSLISEKINNSNYLNDTTTKTYVLKRCAASYLYYAGITKDNFPKKS